MSLEEDVNGRFRNEYHKGVINLVYTVKHLSYGFLQMLKKHGLTEPQYNILKVLRGFHSDGPASIGFLKARMLDKNSDVSRLVDRLFEFGYVDRKENLSDRRQKAVEITQKGIDLLAGMDDCEHKTDSLLKNLSIGEVTELNRLLNKIRE